LITSLPETETTEPSAEEMLCPRSSRTRPAPRFRALLRVWFRSTLAKYLPGSIWPLVTTAAMASRAGACPVALPASFVLHAAFTVLGAGVVAAALAAPGQLARSGVPAAAALAALPAAALLVHPAVLNRLVGAAARLARREAPRWEGRWRHGALFLALYAATWVGYGAAFSLFVGALAPVSPGGWVGLAGVNALAFVAGFVAVFAPGGVGVREAALALALPPVLPFSVRALIAATSRLWLVGTEVAGGALAYALPGGGAVPAPSRAASSRLAASPLPAAPSPPRPGGAAGTVVELLPDSATALGRVAAACRRARRSVWIAQLAFDADCLCEAAADGRGGELLADVLVEAAREPRRVEVRILLNGSILMNTAPALRRYFAEAGADPERIAVRGLDAFPRIMHAKLVVVDGTEAFLVGSPFVNGYWDDGRHRAADPNRTGDDLAGRPIHDVSARVEGPVVGELAAWFAEVWNAAASGPAPDLAAPAPVPAPARPGGGAVRVLRTFPAGVLPGRPDGAVEILEGYLEAIAGARRAHRPIVAVGTTVVRSLEAAARSHDGEVVAGDAETDLCLLPGDSFQVVTDLITNFHLPRSTLLMLVAAFAGKDNVLAAYRDAIDRGYRFYSYGDAMLIRDFRR